MQIFDRSVGTMIEGEKPRPRETQFWAIMFIITGLALLTAFNAFLR